jgi:uncharacterized damage-inducible protein DinB
MTMIDRYRRWFEYEREAHRKTLASLGAVALDQRTTPWFQKAVDLFAHLMAARRMWLVRLGVVNETPPNLFPRGTTFESLEALAAGIEPAWVAYLAGLDDTELVRVVEYRSWEGPRFRNTVEDILTQLFGHSSYHRGQIAQLVRAGGGTPAVTDFIFWSREAIE